MAVKGKTPAAPTHLKGTVKALPIIPTKAPAEIPTNPQPTVRRPMKAPTEPPFKAHRATQTKIKRQVVCKFERAQTIPAGQKEKVPSRIFIAALGGNAGDKYLSRR